MREQLLLGLAREGVATVVTHGGDLPLADAGLVLVLGDAARVSAVRAQLTTDIPLVYVGRGERSAITGADEVIVLPAHLRDVVTIARLLRGVPAAGREHLTGNLAETTNVLTLVRAFSALGRSAVLTLVRGLRRGEIRFYRGEVTSAELGLNHGQAALHQLLLWTEARFELRNEDVVRRQQIPLGRDELFADAERFLVGVRDHAGTLSPALVLEQDKHKLAALGAQVPPEVHGVLRMFDGHRVIADVLEDSPYRVFETLRVAQRAVDVGLLRVADRPRSKATWKAVLGIEDWLTGHEREAVVDEAAPSLDTGPVGRESKPKFKKGRRAKKREPVQALQKPPAEPQPRAAERVPATIDWGALVPRVIGAEVGSLAGVVPAAQRSGEISREKLESLMDTAAREKIFPRELAGEPSVVIAPEPEAATTAFVRVDASEVDAPAAKPHAARIQSSEIIKGDKVTISEGAASIVVQETMTVDHTLRTAHVTSVQTTLLEDPPPPVAKPADPKPADAKPVEPVEPPVVDKPVVAKADADAAPREIDDEPSDGVVRELNPEPTPAPPPRPPTIIIEDDRPGDRTGEITSARKKHSSTPPQNVEPSILVEDTPVAKPADKPAAKADDKPAAKTGDKPSTKTPATKPDKQKPAKSDDDKASKQVEQVRSDAVAAFSDAEEAFFRAGSDKEKQTAFQVTAPVETFDDLDVDYQPLTFWERLRGKKRPAK